MWFHYWDIVIASCKHIYHPWCLQLILSTPIIVGWQTITSWCIQIGANHLVCIIQIQKFKLQPSNFDWMSVTANEWRKEKNFSDTHVNLSSLP